MRKRLATLGFQMALEPIPNQKEPFPLDENGKFMADSSGFPETRLQKTTPSRTAGYTEGAGVSSSPQEQRPLKRQRVESPLQGHNAHAPPTSRDLMPPPTKPLSRMKSMRKIIPTLRKKFSSGRASPAPFSNHASDPDVQMYDDGHWEAVDAPTQPSSDRERPPTRHGYRQETPYMSGALPVECPRQPTASQEYQLLPGVGMRNENAEFTFRSQSPVKMTPQGSSGLPTERSYIRLMDGLSRETGLDLGLQDPRGSIDSQHPSTHQHRQIADAQQSHVETNGAKRRNRGYAFLHQSPDNAPSSLYAHPGHLRSNPTDNFTRAHNSVSINPVTPAPARFHRPVEEVDNVVSPFFKSSNRNSQVFSRPGVAEREDSHNHCGAYRFPRPRATEPQGDWHEPRGLNGLSFMNSPLNERNEPIEYRVERRATEYMATPRHYLARNIDSRGYITRPEPGRSPFLNDSAYGSFNRPYSRKASIHSQSAIPFPSFGRSSQSRAGRLPPTMPSIVSSRSPARSRPQWDNLERVGVRSSHHSQAHIPGISFTTPSRDSFSSTGRRSVRR